MAEERVNGPEDSIESKKINQLPMGKSRDYKILPCPVHASGRSSQFFGDPKIWCSWRKPDNDNDNDTQRSPTSVK